jgi:hypothetical protein
MELDVEETVFIPSAAHPVRLYRSVDGTSSIMATMELKTAGHNALVTCSK